MTTPGGQLTPGDEPEIGDPPIYGVPAGAYVGDAGSPQSFKDLNTLNKDEAKRRMQQPLEGMFGRQRESVWGNGGLLGHIADLLFGPGSGQPAVRISDGMTELNGRLELLDNVPGYAGALLLQNHRFPSGGLRTIPFNKEYGPAKNAYLDTSNHRMYLSVGSWSCHFTIATDSGSAPAGVGHRARVTVRDQNNTIQIQREFTWQNNGSSWEQHYAIPIIAPVNGWSIQLEYAHSIGLGWWSVMGGTGKTLIWVERKNMDSLNWQPFNASNGPDIQ